MTELRLLILGLLDREPRSAYALGNALSEMPAAAHSGSPGAIYPAVRSMQRDGLLERELGPGGKTRGQPYTLTRAGRQVLTAWLKKPVEGWDLIRSPGTVLLKLSFIRSASARREFQLELGEVAAEMLGLVSDYHAAARPRLAESSDAAFQLTSALFEAYVAWAEREDSSATGAT